MPVYEVVKEMAAHVKNLFKSALQLAQTHYTDDRAFEIFGVSGRTEFMTFQGLDLKRPGLAVHVDMDQVYPFTRTMQRDALMSFLRYTGNQLLPMLAQDPAFIQVLFDKVGLPRNEYNVEYNVHIRAAHLEVEAFLADPQGTPLQVDPDFDVHPLHFAVHSQFLVSDNGKALAKTQPPLYQFIRQHALQHKQVIAQQQQQMQQGSAAAPPNGAGGSAPPNAPKGIPRRQSMQSA